MSLQEHKLPLIIHGWVRALLLFIVYVLFSVLAGSVIELYAGGPGTTSEKNSSAETISASPTLLYFGISFIIAFLSVFLFRKYIDRRSFISLGLRPRNIFPGGIIGLLIGIFLVSAGAEIIFFLHHLSWVDLSFRAPDFFSALILLLLVAASEELVFRGYILRNLGKSFDQWLALLISSCLFALVHISNPGIPPIGMLNIFLGGLLLGLTYMYTRNLWAPIFFHFSWNFFQGPVLGFPVSGLPFRSVLTVEETPYYWLNGGEFGYEGSLVCSLLLFLACGIFFRLNLVRRKHLSVV